MLPSELPADCEYAIPDPIPVAAYNPGILFPKAMITGFRPVSESV